MNAVFLDTAGVPAMLEWSDQWHAAATRVWSTLNQAGRSLRTTTLVLLECGNAGSKPVSNLLFAQELFAHCIACARLSM
jgi:hypothetical protein